MQQNQKVKVHNQQVQARALNQPCRFAKPSKSALCLSIISPSLTVTRGDNMRQDAMRAVQSMRYELDPPMLQLSASTVITAVACMQNDAWVMLSACHTGTWSQCGM